MLMTRSARYVAFTVAIAGTWLTASSYAADIPKLGEKLPNISSVSLDKKEVSTDELLRKNKIVVTFLRGYPGYQCPICTRQVAELIKMSEELQAADAQVILIYPGALKSLSDKAGEFFKPLDLPKNFHVIVDQDYQIVNQFGLRWDAKNETTYPATFVTDLSGEIVYALVSEGHGGRAKGSEVLKALQN
jgi:peroxiredoxin